MGRSFTFTSKLVKYPGAGGWFFVDAGPSLSGRIRKLPGLPKVGWGYIKVRANVGKTSWDTTLFPNKKTASYLLAIKAEVRKDENIKAGDRVKVKILIR